MEIKTCEQYVLAQLCEQQDENDRVCAENDRLRKEIRELKEAIKTAETSHGSAIQTAIREAGRVELYRRSTKCGVGVRGINGVKTFDDWCIEVVSRYFLPDDISVMEFIEEFGPELRRDYDERVAEAE